MRKVMLVGLLALVLMSSFVMAGTRSSTRMDFYVYDSEDVEMDIPVEDEGCGDEWVIPIVIVVLIVLFAFIFHKKKKARKNSRLSKTSRTVSKSKAQKTPLRVKKVAASRSGRVKTSKTRKVARKKTSRR